MNRKEVICAMVGHRWKRERVVTDFAAFLKTMIFEEKAGVIDIGRCDRCGMFGEVLSEAEKGVGGKDDKADDGRR